MSSNLDDHARGDARYYGMQMGTVAENADPLGLHRVQVRIPGIAEPSTDWAFPLTAGGGSRDRGGHVVPDVGADVAVWFHQGDPNGAACYLAGWWGIPEAGVETPGDLATAGGDAHLIQVLKIGRIVFTVDERPGKRALRVEDTDGAAKIEIDLEQKGLLIEGLAGVVIKSIGTVAIDALTVNIKGRDVATTSDHI